MDMFSPLTVKNKPFAVVFFHTDSSYSEIPVTWLSEDRLTCLWPKTKNPCRLMAKGIIPDEEKWDRFPVRVEAYCSTLENARKKAEMGSEYSSEEDVENKGRGKRIKIPKTKKSLDSDKESTDSDKESNSTLTPPPSPNVGMSEQFKKGHCSENTEHNNVTSKPTLSIKDQEPVIIFEFPDDANHVDKTLPSEFPKDAHRVDETLASGGTDDLPIVMLKDGALSMTDLYVAIVELTKIATNTQEYVKSIERKLKANDFSEGSKNFSNYFKTLESKLPLKTIDELKEFDLEVNNIEETKTIFTKYVQKIGGDDAKDSVNRIFKCIFSNELGKLCSWYGRKENFAVQPLYIMKLITDIIVMQHNNTTLSSIEHHGAEWFRLANQRFQREMKKTKNT